MKKLTIQDIKNMSYTNFISLIKEENRPSGGKKTIRVIAQNSFINDKSKVLEIGSTNGFSSLEICKITNCSIIGIDINESSIANAQERIALNKLDKNKIQFQYGNAEQLEFKDEIFDLVISGNAMSFIRDKEKAILELIRVLKPNGFISIVPIWYNIIPNPKIIDQVNKELGFKIQCTFEKDWLDFSKYNLELYYKKDYAFICATKEQIDNYVNNMINSKKHLNKYSENIIKEIKNRWKRTIRIFNDNLSMANYSVILLRKAVEKEEEEIFLTTEF